MREHRCKELGADLAAKYPCGYGRAITGIFHDEDGWFADNQEYATRIAFCPFCGVKLAEDQEGEP